MLAVPASAADHDGHIASFSFSPNPIHVDIGDTVTWHWDGPDTNHSVTTDSAQAQSFDSDATNPAHTHVVGDTFTSPALTANETIKYHCSVHSFMHGTIVVGDGGAQPQPPPTGGGAADTTAPTISGLHATGGKRCKPHARHCHAKATVVSLTLSEAATVRVSVGRRTFKLNGQAGKNTLRIPAAKLHSGRYKLTAVATDAAGNKSPGTSARVKVR